MAARAGELLVATRRLDALRIHVHGVREREARMLRRSRITRCTHRAPLRRSGWRSGRRRVHGSLEDRQAEVRVIRAEVADVRQPCVLLHGVELLMAVRTLSRISPYEH